MSVLNQLQRLFEAYRDPVVAAQMETYQKHIAPFIGISTPVRRGLLKEFRKRQGRPHIARLDETVRALYAMPEREYHYTAMELCHDMRKQWRGNELPLFEWMIQTGSWWDTVDFIAIKLVGEFFLRFPDRKNEVYNYLLSGHLWMRRTAIIFQNSYKQKTDAGLLFDAIRSCSSEKEFFIRKAIGWALREYAKTAPDAVRQFVTTHELSPLSRREAMKHL